jgi:hypothetical protein
MIITDDKIELYRLLVLRKGLQLEDRGLKVSRGVSILKILKGMGYTGTRRQILAQLDEIHAQVHRTTDEA